jgi:glycosyltransferase involved in cell wall biosynthesis
MKIALVTDSFTTGGGLEHMYQICLGMPDVEFGVFGNGGDAKEKFESLQNVKIFSNGYSKEQIKAFDPNIVHIHHLKPLIKLYNLDIKTMFTVHGIHLHKYEFVNDIKSNIFRFLRLNLEKYLYRHVNKILTVSDDDKEYLKKYYKIDSEVIYNGIDYEPILKIINPREELRQKLLLPLDKQIFLTVARFDFPKGYDILIEAIKLLKDDNQVENKLFVFVGGGELFKPMQKLVAKYGLTNNILFFGRRTNVYEIMKASDCFILPSRWEGMPITLIEAMACNLPIIASDTYGNRTVKKVEDNVLLFINLDSRDLAQKILVHKNVEYKVIFSIENMTLRVKKIYENS